MTTFEELEKAIYQLPQRDAAQMLLDTKLINMAFITNDVQLTLDRVEQVKALLRAIANDQEHNPTTIRERVMLDITHAISFLRLEDAIYLNEDYRHLGTYLATKYPKYQRYWQSITLKEIERFQRQLRATIEEGMK